MFKQMESLAANRGHRVWGAKNKKQMGWIEPQ
jgi:hypothetical protein